MVKEDFLKVVALEWTVEKESLGGVWEALHPKRGSSKCKGPVAALGFPLSRLAG